MPPNKRRGAPGRNGPSPKDIAAVNGDEPDTSLEIPVCQLVARPVHLDEIPELRAMWWRLAAQGIRLPAEVGVIAIRGGLSDGN